jgi:TolB-like protein
VAALAVLAACVLAFGAAVLLRSPADERPTIAVARFDVEPGGDAALAARLADAVTVRLAGEPGRWSVIGNAAPLHAPRSERDLDRIAEELGAGFVVLGQVWSAEVLVHWIGLPEQKHLWANRIPVTAEGTEDRVADAVAGAVARTLSAPSP